MDIAALVSDPTTIVAWIITVGIPTTCAVYEAYQKGGLKAAFASLVNLGTSRVPQTADQTALITSGKVPDEFWKMTDAAKDELFHMLRNSGAEIRKDDLMAVIAKAEAESQVEYGIIIVDHNGDVDRSIINPLSKTQTSAVQQHEVYHAFVSYGHLNTQTYEETLVKMSDTSSKGYKLESYWYMTDAEKETLMSNIGYNNPKCIIDAQKTIDEAEKEQKESYYVGCGIHTFKVVKGNVTQVGANPKTKEPTTPAAEVAASTA
jgi:hypothetical protein